ncbi:hypothetical protein ACO0K9_02545 [Undibacterium sp. Ji50W]|uniref:hypothetical protein n=1 Tax=Undibacterium sp. Ji50W TaxID=3413041 RepID=UPI003BF0AE08
MARFLPLFSVAIEHDFFTGTPGANWRFTPTPQCAELEKQFRLVLRPVDKGMEMWRESDDPTSSAGTAADTRADDTRDAVLARDAGSHVLCFSYEVSCDDPQFSFYTDWPVTPPLCFSNEGLAQQEPLVNLQASAIPPSSRPETVRRNESFQFKATQFSINIFLSEAEVLHQAVQQGRVSRCYAIHLKSKTIRWKYFFTGSLARKKMLIVDLDANEGQTGIVFETSTQTATDSGFALISQTAIPMQYRPVQQFQLREVGMAGKVLIKRLPNASVNKIGKERGPDGQNLLVAEIYIHQ